MNRLLRDVRLVPIVLFATISLLVLKVSGLVFDGGYTLAQRMQTQYQGGLRIVPAESVPEQTKIVISDRQAKIDAAGRKQPWAQEMFKPGLKDGMFLSLYFLARLFAPIRSTTTVPACQAFRSKEMSRQ